MTGTGARIASKFLSSLGEWSLCLAAKNQATINHGGSRRLSSCSTIMERLRGKSPERNVIIMGIESSCDDTGVAVINESGHVLGDAIHSQLQVHKK